MHTNINAKLPAPIECMYWVYRDFIMDGVQMWDVKLLDSVQ